MIAEWEEPWELETPAGTLPFNASASTSESWRFQLVPARCAARIPVRSTEDDIPQGDGKIAHRRWFSGYQIHLAIALLNGDADDCVSGSDLVGMLDLLGLHLNEAIRTGLVPGSPNARLIWTPYTGAPDDRMFDRVQLVGEPTVTVGDSDALGGTLVEVDFDTVHPYYIAATQNTTDILDGASGTITNEGNVDLLCTLQVFGTFGDGFTITNTSVVDLDGNPLKLVYDSTLPGASAISSPDYIEFAYFNGTAYLNGNSASMKAGIDMRSSDFFPLVPGDNIITVDIDGAAGLAKARFLWNHSYA